MKPILILQNAHNDWPDYFEDYLAQKGMAYQVVNIAQGDRLPDRLDGFSGLGLMGGAMGANDEAKYPHLMVAYALLRQALAQKVPVIGHCLGGQMLAKALGVGVARAHHLEVGWHAVTPTNSALAAQWLGQEPFMTMQWHYDEFALPPQATLLASSEYCPHQAFVVDELFLGMQFHIEARRQKIETWLSEVRSQASAPSGFNCHEDERIKADTLKWAPQAQRVADRLYARWLANAVARDA